MTVDADAAALQLVKAQEQVHQRRLAGTRATDETDLFAGADIQRQILDHALGLAVVEADMVEADRALPCRDG